MEPIAIVGIGCRLPRADNPEEFWRLLRRGLDAVREVPPERWDAEQVYDPEPATPGKMNTRWGGFLDRIDLFDPTFFGISGREAARMDPQQRLLLEVAWESLEDAGIAAAELAGSATGVFVGIANSDYARLLFRGLDVLDAYSATGTALSIAANRMSYLWNLRGPSMAVDTACSSSLVAVHLACHSLGSGECDLALAGGVNLILTPEGTITFSQARMMAPDGRCKTFDARADGYVRGEGCGIFVLKTLRRAQEDGDRVLAVILGSAVNQDGLTNGLTAPNGPSQQSVIRKALAAADVRPAEVSYIEAHGTGTALGDPIEVRALRAVFMEGRTQEQPCWLGSVKTNVGHLESAAGAVGLLKLVLSLRHAEIPPNLHFQQLNPYIDLQETPIAIPTSLTPWPRGGGRIAGVSAFGFGGTNCHMIVAEAPRAAGCTEFRGTGFQPVEQHGQDGRATCERPRHLITVSAKGREALAQLAADYGRYVASHDAVPLADLCYTANVGRAKLTHRAAVAAESHAEMSERLVALADEVRREEPGHFAAPKMAPKIAFLFTGQGSHKVGMGQSLYRTSPVFRETLDRCDEILRDVLDQPLLSVLYPNKGECSPLNQTQYTQPALFAFEYALAETWKSWGVQPAAAVGHSLGEYVAACAAGVFRLEDAIRLVAARARLMQAQPPGGRMVAVMADEATVAELVEPVADKVSLAAVNGPRQVVISGWAEAVEKIVAKLEARGVMTQPLGVSHAFHSPMTDVMLDEFERLVAQVPLSKPSFPIAANVTGRIADDQFTSPDYWRRQARQAVRFGDAIDTLVARGFRVFLEVGPKPVLTGLCKAGLASARDMVWLPSLRQGRDDWRTMLDTLGELFVRGVPIDWRGVDRGYARRKVSLPTYPFQRQRYWGADGQAAFPSTESQESGATTGRGFMGNGSPHPLIGCARPSAGKKTVFECVLRAGATRYLQDHVVFDVPVMPAAGFLEAAMSAARVHFGVDDVAVEDVAIRRALPLAGDTAKAVQLVLSPDDDGKVHFQIFSRDDTADEAAPSWLLHASGKVAVVEDAARLASVDLDALRSRLSTTAEPETFYETLRRRGLDYGPAFRGVGRLAIGETEALGEIRLPDALASDGDPYAIHPALLDASFHVIAGLLESKTSADAIFLPAGVRRLRVYGRVPPRVWSRVEIGRVRKGMRSTATATITLLDAGGEVVAQVEDMLLVEVSSGDLGEGLHRDVSRWLYQIQWRQKPRIGSPSGAATPGNPVWLVFADRGGTGSHVAAELRNYGQRAVLIGPGGQFSQAEDDAYQIAPGEPEDYRRLLESVLADGASSCRGIVHLWSLDSQTVAPDASAARESGRGRPPWRPIGDERAAIGDTRAATEGGPYRGTATESVLLLVQAVAAAGLPASPRLWLVTRGAQSLAATEGVSPDSSAIDPFQSPLWGLGRVIYNEYAKLNCTRIDLDPAVARTGDRAEGKSLFGELWVPDRETEIALRGSLRFVSRLVRYESPKSQGLEVPDEPYELRLSRYGVLTNLMLRPMKRKPPAAGEVEVAVRAAGLNFRDVLRALGMLQEYEKAIGIHSADDATFGFECSGTVVAVGPGVSEYRAGDEVVALSLASMASHVTIDTKYVAPKPAAMSFEEAAAIPLAFLTAYYGLCRLAGLKRGERVLIHSAAGGVGQAAVALAQHVGAEIYATASRGKWEALGELGVEHVADSRSMDFDDEIRRQLAAAGATGVDVVLNALSGDYIPKSLGLLAEHGRFVEIGKIGIWSREQIHDARPDAAYWPFDLGEAERDQPGLIASMLGELLEKFIAGTLRPLPHRVFGVAEAVDAFRFMQQAKHVGKVVLTMPAPDAARGAPVVANASYLVTGGLGSLGLEVARWLVAGGARHVVLVGRREAPSPTAQAAIDALKQAGAEVVVRACDVSKAEDVRRLVGEIAEKMPPLAGIVHAAGVLDDGVLAAQSWERFRGVMAPKIDGAWNLFQATRDVPLDWFVLFSSIAAVVGSPGQGNYAAANAFLDGLAPYLRRHGVPALSINWGPWRGAGMASGSDAARWAAMGLETIFPTAGLAAQEQLLADDVTSAAVLRADWSKFLAQFPRAMRPPLLEPMAEETDGRRSSSTRGKKKGVLDTLSAAPADRKPGILRDFVRGEVARTLGVRPAALDLDQPLTDVGLDSLMAVELKNAIESELEVELPLERFAVGTTIADLAAAAAELLTISTPNAGASAEGNGETRTVEIVGKLDVVDDEPPPVEPGETPDIFGKCERFFVQPSVLAADERLLAGEMFSYVSPPRNAGPWIEAGDRRILQFSSNDYLGLAMHETIVARAAEVVREYGIASPMGSRLMTGTTQWHLDLEARLAAFKRCESAIAFPSGAMAMIGILACLGSPRDVYVMDERTHASLVIGAKASGTKIVYFRHNDLDHLEYTLAKLDPAAARAIVIDGVYSMDGDLAPLPEIVELKNKHRARLIVDDAHGTGVLGENGRGTAAYFGLEDQVDLHAGTFSKAVGTIGGFVTGDAAIVEFIRFHAPTMIFSKSMPLVVVAATMASLDLLEKADDRRGRLWHNKRLLQEGLKAAGADIGHTESPITPVQLSGNNALFVAATLRKQYGIWVAPVIYPAVPVGGSILRIIPTAAHSESDIRYLIESFTAVCKGKEAARL